MLASAGFLDNEYEPRRWDAEAGSDEAEHRRPDFTAVHPVTFQRWVFDVTVTWGAVACVWADLYGGLSGVPLGLGLVKAYAARVEMSPTLGA